MPYLSNDEEVFIKNNKGGLIQSILIPITMNKNRGEQWLEKNGFQYKRFHKTSNYRRYRQFNPPISQPQRSNEKSIISSMDKYPTYRIEHFSDGIMAVIMYS